MKHLKKFDEKSKVEEKEKEKKKKNPAKKIQKFNTYCGVSPIIRITTGNIAG
jgi:hypothetical protein